MKVNPATCAKTILWNNTTIPSTGAPSGASFTSEFKNVTVDANGDYYFIDVDSHRLWQVRKGTTTAIYRGTITGIGSAAVSDIIFSAGKIYLTATGTNKGVYEVNPTTLVGTLVPGTESYSYTDAASATCAALSMELRISGNVFNDGNGLTDGIVNTSGTGSQNPVKGTDIDPAATGNQALYATLVSSGGTAVKTVAVSTNGTYSFTGVTAGTYSVVLSTASAGSTTPSLPASWTNVGENVGTTAGSDGIPNGILTGVSVTTANVTTANFGIDKLPVGNPLTVAAQPNPGGTAQAPIPSTAFTGSDQEDGTYPNNLTGLTVILSPATNGTLYYDGNPVSTTTTITNFDPTKVTLDPVATGATTGSGGASPNPTFTYSVKDNAGIASAPVILTVPFSAPLPTVSGSVWNDADGSVTQNGSETGTNAGGPLYVNLVNGAGTVVASTTVAADGTYSLTGIPTSTTGLKLVLTNSASNTAPALPTGWVNTGEPASVGNGATQSATLGVIELNTGTTSLTNQSFGIEQLPTSGSGTATVANNGGSTGVTVPPGAFTSTSPSTDTAPGSVTAIKITSFPSNVTSLTVGNNVYTASSFPGAGIVVPTDGNGSPTVAIVVDPTNDGDPVVIPFKAIDNAGKESANTGSATLNSTAPTVPDLTPIIYALPTVVNGTTPITIVVDVVELLGTPTSGTIRVYVSKDARTSLGFSASDVSVGDRSVSNSV